MRCSSGAQKSSSVQARACPGQADGPTCARRCFSGASSSRVRGFHQLARRMAQPANAHVPPDRSYRWIGKARPALPPEEMTSSSEPVSSGAGSGVLTYSSGLGIVSAHGSGSRLAVAHFAPPTRRATPKTHGNNEFVKSRPRFSRSSLSIARSNVCATSRCLRINITVHQKPNDPIPTASGGR